MNIFEIIGMIVVAIGAIGALKVVYDIVRGFVLACHFILWQYAIAKQNKPYLKFSIRTFFRGVFKNWVYMIGYTPESFTCQIGSSVWNGFRSWKKQ